MNKSIKKRNSGFTLMEIPLVILVVIILLLVANIVVTLSKSFSSARNSQRSFDVRSIKTAIVQYAYEKDSTLTSIGSIPSCPLVSTIGTDEENIDLSFVLVTEYLSEIPKDPSVGTDKDTGYAICVTSKNRIVVSAPHTEGTKVIKAM